METLNAETEMKKMKKVIFKYLLTGAFSKVRKYASSFRVKRAMTDF